MKLIHLLTTSTIMKEFGIEIPDAEADEIKTVQQGQSAHTVSWQLPGLMLWCCSLPAIDYIAKTPDGEFSVVSFFFRTTLSYSGCPSEITYCLCQFHVHTANNNASRLANH